MQNNPTVLEIYAQARIAEFDAEIRALQRPAPARSPRGILSKLKIGISHYFYPRDNAPQAA
jgi:hypothetical protein